MATFKRFVLRSSGKFTDIFFFFCFLYESKGDTCDIVRLTATLYTHQELSLNQEYLYSNVFFDLELETFVANYFAERIPPPAKQIWTLLGTEDNCAVIERLGSG